MLRKLMLVALLITNPYVSYAKSVAITIDNPNMEFTPLLSAEKRDKQILTTLTKYQLSVVLFAQGAQIDSAVGRGLLNRWNEAGQTIGNHTYSHTSLNETDVYEYETDFLRNEKLLTSYSNFKKIFRFPFLKEGDTEEKRDAFRIYLHDHHYQAGSITIDTSDWYISDRLEKRLANNRHANVNNFKKYYLNHVWNRALYYDKLAVELLGYSPKHVLLVHHNLLNALFLGDVIKMFKQHGWDVIDAENAFQDPVYQHEPNSLPAGESLIWGLAKESGKYENKLRYPGEDSSYEKVAMDKLGL
jgi:peptidoglycan/xylan/chitin deacetylase (PgdA/CDA1 family)